MVTRPWKSAMNVDLIADCIEAINQEIKKEKEEEVSDILRTKIISVSPNTTEDPMVFPNLKLYGIPIKD